MLIFLQCYCSECCRIEALSHLVVSCRSFTHLCISTLNLTYFHVGGASFEWEERLQAAQAELEQVRIERQKSEKECKSLEYNVQLQVKYLDG